MKDQFLRPAKSQSKWYGLFSDHKVDTSAISTWSRDASVLNSCYSRIARLHHNIFHKKLCKDGRSRLGRPGNLQPSSEF